MNGAAASVLASPVEDRELTWSHREHRGEITDPDASLLLGAPARHYAEGDVTRGKLFQRSRRQLLLAPGTAQPRELVHRPGILRRDEHRQVLVRCMLREFVRGEDLHVGSLEEL